MVFVGMGGKSGVAILYDIDIFSQINCSRNAGVLAIDDFKLWFLFIYSV